MCYGSVQHIAVLTRKCGKSSCVLGSELWESKFNGLLALVKEYIVDVWEI